MICIQGDKKYFNTAGGTRLPQVSHVMQAAISFLKSVTMVTDLKYKAPT